MVEDQPAVPCNNIFSRAQKTRVRGLLPQGAFHMASLLLLWMSGVFIKGLSWEGEGWRMCLWLFQGRVDALLPLSGSLCLPPHPSKCPHKLSWEGMFVSYTFCLAGRSREPGNLLSLVNSEWFRLNGQPSLALRKSEFHGSPHGQALSLSLKDPFFSILCIMQVQKDQIWDNCGNCHGNNVCLSSFHWAPTTARPWSITGALALP